MSKRTVKVAASSGRAVSGFGGFGSSLQPSSTLSYIQEPLDYSTLAEPSLAVTFKNLSKKDDTTKTKALDELFIILKSSPEATDYTIAELWVRVFPRLCIDNNRRVRQLAQLVNGRLCSKLGKGTAKYLPQLVGPWLAAQFDGDKAVAKAAGDALVSIFPDATKRIAVWTIFAKPILNYCKAAVLEESVSTLSDERTIKPEDAQLVYVRTMASCLQTLASLIRKLDSKKCDECAADLSALLEEKVLAFAVHGDSSLRRAAHSFTQSTVTHSPEVLQSKLKLLSNYYVYKGLASDQQASQVEYIETLTAITTAFPSVWTGYYSGKKTVVSRLTQLFEAGPGRRERYWSACKELVEALPQEIIPMALEPRTDLIQAVRKGLYKAADTPNDKAWRFYISYAIMLGHPLESEQQSFYTSCISPVIENFCATSYGTNYPDRNRDMTAPMSWYVAANHPSTILAGFRSKVPNQCLDQPLTISVNRLIESMKRSEPATSSRFGVSQDAITKDGTRHADMMGVLAVGDSNGHVLLEAKRLVEAAFELLVGRKGKPYGAASVIEAHMSVLGDDFARSVQLDKGELSGLLGTPCSHRIWAIIEQKYPPDEASTMLEHLAHDIPEVGEEEISSLIKLASKLAPAQLDILKQSPSVQSSILSLSKASPNILSSILTADLASQTTTERSIASLENDLNDDLKVESALQTLDAIAKDARPVLEGDHVQLIARVLELRDSADDQVAELAGLLASRLSVTTDSAVRGARLIRHALSNDVLDVSQVLELAENYLGDRISPETLVDCFPHPYNWRVDLSKQLQKPNPESSIESPLGVALHFVGTAQGTSPIWPAYVLKTAWCISHLIGKVDVSHSVTPQLLEIFLFSMIAAVGLPHEIRVECDASLIATVQRLSETDFRRLMLATSCSAAGDDSAMAYCIAMTRLRWLNARSDQSLFLQDAFPDVLHQYKSMNLFDASAAFECEMPQPDLLKICNQLVSDVTAGDLAVVQRELALLAVLLTSHTQLVEDVSKQRVLFLIKHLLAFGYKGALENAHITECLLQVMTAALPTLSTMYGEIWADTLDLLQQIWEPRPGSGTSLSVKYASVRLYNKLVQLARTEGTNEDLVEVMEERQQDMVSQLIYLMTHALRTMGSEEHLFELWCELIKRSLTTSPVAPAFDAGDMYGMLHEPSAALRRTAFLLLQRLISSSVEEISVNAALEKKAARLPPALLSSVLDTSSKAYIYAWTLIFEHMKGASYKVQTDYVEQLKDGQYLNDLLPVVFEGLGLSKGKPAEFYEYNLTQYEANLEQDPVKDLQWHLAHMYYLSLRYVPSLVKTSLLESRSRQLPSTVEKWTAKYISPLLIDNSLDAVSTWAGAAAKEEPEMQVIVGAKSKEISVKYVVDEQTMAIKVVLPDAYPLTPAQVIGVHRVAVKEEKWQSWLRNCQGVITFSNGSITDGLTAWRRNVTGALKGQTECAICYSIISADKQLPTKKCPTCKNLFHSSCLFKWFKTSNASTCPLCRNQFNFN